MEIEELAAIAVDCGFKLHVRLGPGLNIGNTREPPTEQLRRLTLFAQAYGS